MIFARFTAKPSPRLRGLAAFLAVTVAALGLFAVAPPLHDALHHDAGHATHYCAVDLFAAGVALAAAAAVLRPVLLLPLGSIEPGVAICFTRPTWRLPPGRGPPAVSE